MEVVVNVGFTDGIAGEVTLRKGFNRIRECFAVHLLSGMRRGQPVLRFTSGLTIAEKRGHFGLLGLRITFRGVPYTFGLLGIRKGMSGQRVQRPDGLYDLVVDIAPVQVTTLWPARTPFTVRTVDSAQEPETHAHRDWLVPSNQMPGDMFASVHQNLENRVIEALRSGGTDWSVDLCYSDMGPWRPMGLREGYTEGGNGICPCPGFEYRDNLNLLRADCWAERTRIDLFDAEGNPAPYKVKPDLQRTGNFMDRWGGPDWAKPFNNGYNGKPESWTPTGDCAYTGNLLTYDGVDMEHGIRQVADSMAGAARGDKACAINVEQIGMHVLAAMPTDKLVSPTVDQRGGMGRLHGWAAWTMAGLAQLYSRSLVPNFNSAPGRATRSAEVREWVKEMARLFVKAQTPSGLWQAVSYPWPNWSPPPQSANVPKDRLLAQSHEHGILIAGAFACWATLVYPDERRLRNALGRAIMRAAEVWTRDGAPTPRKWLVAGIVGEMGDRPVTFHDKVIETHGDDEGLYRFWSAAYASIVANTPEDNMTLAEKIRAYGRRWLYGRPDPTRFSRAILKMADVQTPTQLRDYWLIRFPLIGERDEHQLTKDEPLLRAEGEKLVPAMIVLGMR